MKRLLLMLLILAAIVACYKSLKPKSKSEGFSRRDAVVKVYYKGQLYISIRGVILDSRHVMTIERFPEGADEKDFQFSAIFPGLQKDGEMKEIPLKILNRKGYFLELEMDKPDFMPDFVPPKIITIDLDDLK